MKLDKLMYMMAHLITPVLLLIVGVFWGHFISNKPIASNLTDNLSVIAIYYIIISVIWTFNWGSIHNLAKKSEKK